MFKLSETIWWLESAAFAQNCTNSVYPSTCDFKFNMDPQVFGINQLQSVQLPDRVEKVNKGYSYKIQEKNR